MTVTFKEIEAEVIRLGKLLDDRIAEDIKYRRMIEDLMYNLSFENMPSVQEETQKTASAVSAIVGTIDGVSAGISSIEQTVDAQGAKIALVVGKGDSGEDVINTASIVSAINSSGSSIKMSADKIQFEGSDVTFDTNVLRVDADGCVSFSAPLSAPTVYASNGNFNGRVDLGSTEGLTGYVYLNSGESNQLEIVGDGGVDISTESESGDSSGYVEIYGDGLYFNSNEVLTKSAGDIQYLKAKLGL